MINPTSSEDEAVYRYAHAIRLAGGLHGSFGHWQAVWQHWEGGKKVSKPQLPMPELAIQGDDSFGVNAHDTMRQVATDVTIVTIENCGHYVPEESPEALARDLLAFFECIGG